MVVADEQERQQRSLACAVVAASIALHHPTFLATQIAFAGLPPK
jgi:hypothetical protein